MKRDQWKKNDSGNGIHMQIGGIKLVCIDDTDCTWYAYAAIYPPGDSYNRMAARYGGTRFSLNLAKEDAVRLAKELLEEFRIGAEVVAKRLDRVTL